MTRILRAPALALAGALLFSAASASLLSHDRISTKVTWTHDIARIVEARCSRCHGSGGRSTIALTTYEEARPWARAIREQVLARKMPVWQAARGYGDFANDPSLSPFEIALIAAWVEGGAPKGVAVPAASAVRERPSAGGPGAKPTGAESRQVTLPCGTQPLSGRLLAINPQLAPGGSAGIAALLPDGRREVVAWIRDYDPSYPTTYWLRTPLLLPSGSRLSIEASGDCTLAATITK